MPRGATRGSIRAGQEALLGGEPACGFCREEGRGEVSRLRMSRLGTGYKQAQAQVRVGPGPRQVQGRRCSVVRELRRAESPVTVTGGCAAWEEA